MFALKDAAKSFAGKTALAPITLAIAPGRTTALIGPSGCGKSTLLRLLIGLVEPDEGEVRFDGTAVDRASAPRLRRRMGYVIQDGGLFPHLTARANAALMARHLGWPRAAIEERIAALAALTRLPRDILDRYPAEISGGQRQRVSLMRALMLDPEVLLLDEPLGALDPIVRYELQTDLRDIFRSLEKTVVLVTHDIGEAGYFADTLVLLRDGRIVQEGTLADLVHRPVEPFVERFVTAQRGLADVIAQVS
ncbi:MAG: ATP-binding cassette domain-containing protein [Alphaproteobacteria bacterium]|nr:ATP-binding cassette domain-containing protein [Alphaproteobacteria bacterium]